jgi:hypothetical protein
MRSLLLGVEQRSTTFKVYVRTENLSQVFPAHFRV